MSDYAFDRFLRYEAYTRWLQEGAAAFPGLLTVESYGRSFEGRELWLATVTDATTGPHHEKPAHWVDANIHSVELATGVAAMHLIFRLVTGFGTDARITRALQSRTFYIVPRVNPDGVEWALADQPRFRRSSVRPWPWRDGRRAPGLHERDMDGDGRILSMRIPDPNGWWMPSPRDPRLLVPVPPEGPPEDAAAPVARYRLLCEGEVVEPDGFTIPTPRPPEGLDLNRNFPAGWGPKVRGSGDHPQSEPEVDALVRALVARPNVCGYNALHTCGGVLLRPSSTAADATLPPLDLWVWRELGRRGTELTGYPVHSVFEDFTWDRTETMSGAADDWAYEHLGIYGWTTELWDVVHAATGKKVSTHFWYTGPTEDEEHAVLAWVDAHHPELFVPWYAYDHPQLGPVELGGWDEVHAWSNPPGARLLAEVRGHAEFAVHQALAAPCLAIPHVRVTALGPETWRVEVGVSNTGWLPTDITERARKLGLVLPLTVGIEGAQVLSGPATVELGQLEGSRSARFNGRNDGTPDRVLATWVVRGGEGTEVQLVARHPRAGVARASAVLRVEAYRTSQGV